jgi:hypothetical protein
MLQFGASLHITPFNKQIHLQVSSWTEGIAYSKQVFDPWEQEFDQREEASIPEERNEASIPE